MCSIPIGELVGTAVGASDCYIDFGATWHIVDEGDEVVDSMRIVDSVILCKEFRPVSDALYAKARAAIPRYTFEELADGRGNTILCA